MSENDIDDYFSSARVTGRSGAVELPVGSYTEYLYPLDEPMIADSRGMSWQEFGADKRSIPFVQELLAGWDELYRAPFAGLTSDGVVRQGLYPLPAPPSPNDPAPVAAAERMLALLDDAARDRFGHDIDAPEWRAWSNPEFVIREVGLRLETLDPEVLEAFDGLMRASLSPEGYERVREAMALNGYLGELVDLPAIMNDRSYWVSLFGTPSVHEPWGWQLFGHHAALNVVFAGGRQVIAPVFLGAEPALSEGVHPPLFEARERIAIELAESLAPEQRVAAVVYDSVLDPAMPAGRLHPADERHVAGAFRDNAVVPYEGIAGGRLDERQWELVRAIAEDFLLLLPEVQRRQTLADVDRHRAETWFSWYGATDGSQPFYLRIQSPVIIAELDHHAGVWLSNRLPARFHVHTTLRLPNGNDYGRAYLAQSMKRRTPVESEADSSAS